MTAEISQAGPEPGAAQRVGLVLGKGEGRWEGDRQKHRSKANDVRHGSFFTFSLISLPTGDDERSTTKDPGLWIPYPVSPCQPHQQGDTHPPGRVRKTALPVPELADVQLCPLT